MAEGLLLPDFCSGAAGPAGRFSEGFSLRRLHKHLNPIVERVRGYRGDGKTLTFLQGPDTSDQAIQQAWFALERGSRFIVLAVTTFIHDLERPEVLTDSIRRDLESLASSADQLQQTAAQRWPEHYRPTA